MNARQALSACILLITFNHLAAPAFAKNPSVVPVMYEVSLANPEKHLFHVLMKVPEVSGELTIQMPAWNALYQIRDFSSHVQRLEAHVGAAPVQIEKIDKQTWRILGEGTVRIDYDTFWDEPGPFATQLNPEHAFINPAMILMFAPGRTEDKTLLSVADLPDGWRLDSALHFECGDVLGKLFCRAEKSTYTEIADAPIEVGKFDEFQITGMNPPISVAVHGDKWKKGDVQDALRRICSYEVKLMGGAPYEHYTFIFHVGKAAAGAGGGMEHANSTAISVHSEEDLPTVAAHEFFHLWNVKRIRPATLEPTDYTKEQYTRALWFAEGVTSTYAAYTLARTQIWTKEQFYFDLSSQITELESRPANRWQSAEQSSLDTWLDKYPVYNRPQNSISYYAKGQVLGVLLDILIRDRTNDEQSLDEVLRAMNVEFAQKHKPYRDSLDVRLTAEKVAGNSFADFFEKYVANAEPLPYQTVLLLAGLELRATEHKRPTLGFYAERDSAGTLTVREVDAESPAAAALRIGDVIVTWNGGEPPRNQDRWVYSQKPGSTLRLTARRDEQEVSVEFRLGETTETFYRIAEDSHASEKARRIRAGILHGTTQPITAKAQ